MPQENSLIAEMRRRLDHLRAMPETPPRRREILGLERALEQAARQSIQKTATGKVVRRRKKAASVRDDDTVDEKPIRQVVHKDGKRRVIIRKARQSTDGGDDGTEKQKIRMDDIRSMIGLSHRGMS